MGDPISKLNEFQHSVYDGLVKQCAQTAAASDVAGTSSFTVANGQESKKYTFKNANICHVAALGYAINLNEQKPAVGVSEFLSAQAGLTLVIDKKTNEALAFFGDMALDKGLRCLLAVGKEVFTVKSCAIVDGTAQTMMDAGSRVANMEAMTTRLGDARAVWKALQLIDDSYSFVLHNPDGLSIVSMNSDMSTTETDNFTGESHIYKIHEDDDGSKRRITVNERTTNREGALVERNMNMTIAPSLSGDDNKAIMKLTVGRFSNDTGKCDMVARFKKTTVYVLDHEKGPSDLIEGGSHGWM